MRLSVDSLTCGWCWCWPDGRPGHTDSGRPDLLLTGRHSQTCWCPPTPPGSQQHWSEECLLYCLFLILCFPACRLPLYNVLTTGRERAGRLTSQIYNATESPQQFTDKNNFPAAAGTSGGPESGAWCQAALSCPTAPVLPRTGSFKPPATIALTWTSDRRIKCQRHNNGISS